MLKQRINTYNRICTGSDFQTHMPSVLYLKKLISKKTYQDQHINFVRQKGLNIGSEKSLPKIFFFFFLVIFFRENEIKSRKFTYFCLFALSYPVRTPRGLCRALEKLGEAKTA